MPQLIQLPGLWQALAEGDLDLSAGGSAQLEIRLTNTAHNSAWTTVTDLAPSVITDHFASDALVVSGSGINLGGDGKMDIAVADQDFTSVGNPTGPFQYIYVVDLTSGILLAYANLGSPQTIPAGFALQIRSSDAADRYISISS